MEKMPFFFPRTQHRPPACYGNMPEPLPFTVGPHKPKGRFCQIQFSLETFYLPVYDRSRKMDKPGAAMDTETFYR